MDFNIFKETVRTSFRIDLNSYKENQLKRRMDSLMGKKKVEAGDYEGFLKLLISDRRAYIDFLDTITINVSEFFRDRLMFKFLEEKVFPLLLEKKNELKIWSAACSSGAEPYSFAMILDEITPASRHQIEGTDIDSNILNAAAQGCYNPDQVRNVGSVRLSKYFRLEANVYLLSEHIKKKVSFRQHDLLLDRYGHGYDLIACRNVAIYFTREAQEKVNQQFVRALNSGGVLFIGASEMILNYNDLGLEKLSSCFYRKILQ